MIAIEKPKALYLQIAAYFENEIVSGRLAPGNKIPATTALAKQFKVNADTIQQSLKLLMSRGLIDRKPGRGTYVRQGVNTKTVGIIYAREVFTEPDNMFFASFMESLSAQLEKDGWHCELFVTGKTPVYDKGFFDLKTKVESGDIRAVVEICANSLVSDWLDNECPVPKINHVLSIDFFDFTIQGLEYLYHAGCRHIMVQKYPESGVDDYNQAIKEFMDAKHDDKLCIESCGIGCHTRDGYASVKQFHDVGKRFDGLLSGNDCAFRGTLYALLECGYKIPDEIKLVTYANQGIEIFCHVPLTRLEVDVEHFVLNTIKDMKAKLAGKQRESSVPKINLVKGKSCGE